MGPDHECKLNRTNIKPGSNAYLTVPWNDQSVNLPFAEGLPVDRAEPFVMLH